MSRQEHYAKLMKLFKEAEPFPNPTNFHGFAIEYLCNELSITDQALSLLQQRIVVLERALISAKTSTILADDRGYVVERDKSPGCKAGAGCNWVEGVSALNCTCPSLRARTTPTNISEEAKALAARVYAMGTTDDQGLEFIHQALTAAAQGGANIPKGWRLVPFEPTLEMCLASDENSKIGVIREVVADGWKINVQCRTAVPKFVGQHAHGALSNVRSQGPHTRKAAERKRPLRQWPHVSVIDSHPRQNWLTVLTPKQHALLGSHMKDLLEEIDTLRAAGWKIAAERDRLKAINVALAEENERLRENLADIEGAPHPTERYREAVAEITSSRSTGRTQGVGLGC